MTVIKKVKPNEYCIGEHVVQWIIMDKDSERKVETMTVECRVYMGDMTIETLISALEEFTRPITRICAIDERHRVCAKIIIEKENQLFIKVFESHNHYGAFKSIEKYFMCAKTTSD